MFVGENLTNIRIMHGYSRKQLSDILGVTEQAIWQYEHDYTTPKMNTINELKQIFHVKSKFFFSEDILSNHHSVDNINFMQIAYRSKVVHVLSKTHSEAKHMEYLDAFVHYVTQKVRLPLQPIIRIRDEVINYLQSSTEDRTTQILKIAHLAREGLGIESHSNDNIKVNMKWS
ncbi:Transcriptional regulator, contains XRE-family HTH domain [Terribacillus saccharophilus]|uniref:Transcriptional regulator, contains XRE-family HTH domain n=1 Tax=Terribacillus saccharophilus TaxID=361277 RepID=A0AAX2EHF3_9BACI|nr:Transcriptional regulator, contains XRE-family HTH domain [Terribacillus saccharophilus]